MKTLKRIPLFLFAGLFLVACRVNPEERVANSLNSVNKSMPQNQAPQVDKKRGEIDSLESTEERKQILTYTQSYQTEKYDTPIKDL